MKLLFVISTLDTGGAQRALSNLVCNLPDDWDIHILVNDDESIKYPYKGNIISLGMKKSENRMSVIYQSRVATRRIIRLIKLKRYNGYDACISFMESANFANVLSGKKHCKVILSERNNLSMAGKNSKTYSMICVPLVRLLYNRADKIVCVSKSVLNDLKDTHRIREDLLDCVYNGVDIDRISEKSREISEYSREMNDGIVTFVTMGRLTRQKGQWHLIKAFNALLKEHPKARLLILGDGSLKTALRDMINQFGIEDEARILGFVDNPYSIMAQSDIFVFPSIWEGFSNAIIEAMACGLPVISTDHDSGAREILAPDTDVADKTTDRIEMTKYGILIPQCSAIPNYRIEGELEIGERFLYEAMCLLYEAEETRCDYSKKAHERALQMDIRNMAEGWKKIIIDVAKRNK